MKRYALNLRCFFGPEASYVWSLWRDRQRALRSVELYENVIEQLKVDLAVEKAKRGTLVRVRSNDVTAVKEKLQDKSEQRLKVNKDLQNEEGQIDTFLGRMDVRLRSIFTNASGIAEIKESINKSRKEQISLEKEMEKMADELSKAVYKQNAAKDPIKDLEFAIEHLNDAIIACHQRADQGFVKINKLIIQECVEGGPLQLESMLMNGLKPCNAEAFCELYLQIHDEGTELIAKPFAPRTFKECDYEQEVQAGFSRKTISSKVNINMSGTGSHHRKVRRGKSRVWREFDINFSGTVNTSFTFKQTHWDKVGGASALKNKALEQFHSGRNEKLRGLEEEFEVSKSSLMNGAYSLFEQFQAS